MRNKSCPCEFGNPCRPQCSCADNLMSGACSRCCRYGSEKQQKGMAKALINNEILLKEAIKALESIALLGGNLPDERLTSKTGANDAVARGIMYTAARKIASSYLEQKASSEKAIFEEFKHE